MAVAEGWEHKQPHVVTVFSVRSMACCHVARCHCSTQCIGVAYQHVNCYATPLCPRMSK
jgi:hypothetical protein